MAPSNPETQERAERAVAWIRANVEAWYTNIIDHAEFTENQRVAWDEIHRDRELSDAVAEIMLDDLRAHRER
jgi:hypothetical protein